jgi:hypothetical protein
MKHLRERAQDWCFSGYLLWCFRAAFYDHALPHSAKLGGLRNVSERLRPSRLVS